jgi:hypothetical protein
LGSGIRGFSSSSAREIQKEFRVEGAGFQRRLRRHRRTEYDIIGSLDADVSFAPDYIEFLLNCFG